MAEFKKTFTDSYIFQLNLFGPKANLTDAVDIVGLS